MAWKTERQRTQARLWMLLGMTLGAKGWISYWEQRYKEHKIYFASTSIRTQLDTIAIQIRQKMKEIK